MDSTEEEQAEVTQPTASDNPAPTEPTSSSVVVDPTAPTADELEEAAPVQDTVDVVSEVASKIAGASNILIALSADPSVDELSAAIGLSLYLDRTGKRATAIYSGGTPNALEFLKPEETFESTADALQDFVIALNKEKADHLRYKLDGDYVKVFITPYRTRIAEEDLDFSYGDFNVDLVLALDVANGIDLDSALREHGRIMHDASIINITTGKPGKFGEIEWSDTAASSVSEMIASLLYSMNSKVKIEKEEATAFLTGIVAATNRFSNATTRPETMRLASRLMESGANQQLVAKNITPDVDNELGSLSANFNLNQPTDTDPTKLDIEHAGEEGIDETKVIDANVSERESTLLDDLKEAEASLAQAGAEATPETRQDLFKIDENAPEAPNPAESAEAEPTESAPAEPAAPETSETTEATEVAEPATESTASEAEPTESASAEPTPAEEPAAEPIVSSSVVEPTEETTEETAESAEKGSIIDRPEKVIAPSSDFGSSSNSVDDADKYGQMLEEALTEAGGANVSSISAPIVSPPDEVVGAPATMPAPGMNPAIANAPAVPTAPEINGVPQMNYMPYPGEEVLPPPPAPPIDMNSPVPGTAPMPAPAPMPTAPTMGQPTIATAAPVEPPVLPSLGSQPAMTDQVYRPQADNPSAFKIPGA